MSHSEFTSHLRLPQFIDDDKPSWRGDVNEAFRVIDAAVAKIVEDVSADVSNLPVFDTLTRPVYGTSKAGTLVFDRTLKLVIVWTGAQWTNLVGTVV